MHQEQRPHSVQLQLKRQTLIPSNTRGVLPRRGPRKHALIADGVHLQQDEIMSLLLSLCAVGYQMAPPPHVATNRRPYASRVTPIMDVSLSDHELCVYLCKTTLKEQPGWAEGKGITTTLLASQIEEWTDDLDDEFYDAIFALEEAGFLRVDDNADDEDVLFNAQGGRSSCA